MAALAKSPVILQPWEVATLLSPREFTKLCGILDGIYGKSVKEVSNVNTKEPKYAIRNLGVKFDVLDILRTKEELNVTVTVADQGAVRVTVK